MTEFFEDTEDWDPGEPPSEYRVDTFFHRSIYPEEVVQEELKDTIFYLIATWQVDPSSWASVTDYIEHVFKDHHLTAYLKDKGYYWYSRYFYPKVIRPIIMKGEDEGEQLTLFEKLLEKKSSE